jgi:hypothetical protein
MNNPHLASFNLMVNDIDQDVPYVVYGNHNTEYEFIISKVINYFLDTCDDLGVKTYVK